MQGLLGVHALWKSQHICDLGAHKLKQDGTVSLSWGLAQTCLHIRRMADALALLRNAGFAGQFGIQGWGLWKLLEEDGPVGAGHGSVVNVMVHQIIEDTQTVFGRDILRAPGPPNS